MKEENNLSKTWKFDFSCPNKWDVDIQKLKKFIDNDKDAVIIFYGGEPLLQIEKIKEIIDKINVPFRMQTNGKLLDKLPIKYLNKIDKILISLDGSKERTDYNRGYGTFDKVIFNINKIKSEGYKGELIARMTISEFPDVYEQVKNLVDLGFKSIHWQLDAGFYKCDFSEDKFSRFVEEYNKSVSKLISYWIDEISKGNFIRIYPFVAIVDSLLKNEKTLLRCGAGHSGYAICPNGEIVACPIMNCIKDFEAGDLDFNFNELKKFTINECSECDIRDICGGRCLYWRKAKLWDKKGDGLICNTIKHLVSELKNKIPEINRLIDNNTATKNDFEYEKYFGPEIIP